jgi:thymidylate synthase
MARIDIEYHRFLETILEKGVLEKDPNRVGIRRLGIPNYNMEFNMSEGFPVLSTKKMWFHGIVGETINCLRGPMDLKYLHANKIHIWDGDISNLSYVPHIYGDVWRNWKNPDGTTTDQLKNIIDKLKTSPKSSDLIIFGDNPSTWSKGIIKSCMNLMQFSVFNGKLDLSINYRSWDALLGAPWNIVQYSLILHIISKITGIYPGTLYINARNVHIYEPHLDFVREQLTRDPSKYPDTNLFMSQEFHYMTYQVLCKDVSLDTILAEMRIDMFTLDNYQSYPPIKAEMLAYSN